MKRIFLLCFLTICAATAFAQTTYYWVGGSGPASITSGSNWNTLPDGSGTGRTTAASTDVLIFDGSNMSGTRTVTVTVTSTNFAALKLTNGITVNIQRPAAGGGTGTITINGDPAGDDFMVDAGSTLNINSPSADGNVVFVFSASATGLISGTFSMSNTGTHRMNIPTPGALVFAAGSVFKSNTIASHPFGSSSQSVEKGVVFLAGASLFYEGGFSPMGNSSAFSAIDFKPGSNWYHRANNAGATGSFFNTKSFGNIIVENNATLSADGPIYRIGNLTIGSGSSMTMHSSGQTVILGDLTVNGSLTAIPSSTNTIVLGGNSLQTVAGTGTLLIPSFVVADNSELVLDRDVAVTTSANIYGKINFAGHQITGAGTFNSRVGSSATSVTGNLVAGSYQITGVVGALSNLNGLTVTGAGIAPNTNVVGFSSSSAMIALSKPVVAGGTNVPLSFSSDGAVLATAHVNGFDSLSGAVIVTGTKAYQSGTSYIFNGATQKPFGFSSGSTATTVTVGSVVINAPVATNSNVNITDGLNLNNARFTINAPDTVHLFPGATITGTNATAYVVTGMASGTVGVLRADGITASTLFPVGTAANYLPVTLNPTTASDFAVNVFEGITADGTPAGVPFTNTEKQMAVDAVWNINRLTGTGDANVKLQWTPVLEGTTMAGFDNSEIGIINYTGSGWSLPFGSGDNATNTADTLFSAFGLFSVAARPPQDPFLFNPLPVKTYGDADFSGGAISSNTTSPIIYTSSNTAVASIVGDKIHITGAGTADITASQASNGVYPAASITQPLTVQKTNLTITADNKLKPEGDPNPPLTATYTGFVYNETQAVLNTPVSLVTTATTASPVGTYPITASGATAANYTITFVDGTLTVNPRQHQTITFAALPVKVYGNANFAAGATSTNTTIPITYTSSNTSVATITGNTIRIVGAGTSTITASQAGSPLYHPAPSVAQVLTVNKANLTVRTFDTTRLQGESNPDFRIAYSGFVNGETVSSLATAPTASTSATASSAPGYYPITLSGGVSNNYNFVYTNARLTVLPSTGAEQTNLQAFMSSSSTLTVRVFATEPDLANIIIYDMGGKPVLTKNVFLAKGFLSFTLPVSHLAPGAYTVSVRGSIVQLRKNITIVR